MRSRTIWAAVLCAAVIGCAKANKQGADAPGKTAGADAKRENKGGAVAGVPYRVGGNQSSTTTDSDTSGSTTGSDPPQPQPQPFQPQPQSAQGPTDAGTAAMLAWGMGSGLGTGTRCGPRRARLAVVPLL